MEAAQMGWEGEPLVIDDRARNSFKVNRRVFTEPAMLDLERRRIFERCWLYLGHESELASPGSFVSRKVGGRALIFIRDRDGVVRALFNTCTHRGATVCRERAGVARGFQCPYHGWTFRDDGTLHNIPDAKSYATGFGSDGSLNLKAVQKLDAVHGFYFVCFDPKAIPLQDYLADSCDVLSLVSQQGANGVTVVPGTNEYSIRANWKLLLENSADGYHAASTHASYFDYLNSRDGGLRLRSADGAEHKFDPKRLEGAVQVMGNGHVGYESIDGAPWGRPVARWVPGWGEEARAEVDALYAGLIERLGPDRARRVARGDRNTLIFPNFVVLDNMGVTIRTFYPSAPDHLEVNAWGLAAKDESGAMRERRLRNLVEFHGAAGFSTPDDAEVLEMCQRGYANNIGVQWNDISKGMPTETTAPAKSDELQMRTFWRRWHELMTASG